AFELSREHQIDQNRRQQECAEKLVSFSAKLSRLAPVVPRESPRHNLLCFVFEESQRLVQWNLWRNDALNADGIHLLKFLQLARLNCRAQSRERGQRDQLVVGSRDVHLRKLIRRQALCALDLRDHLVTPALNAEPVYVVPADQGRKILTGFSQI